jgi:hypothetical protein
MPQASVTAHLLAAAVYVGCFEGATCSPKDGVQPEMTLLAEDPAMTPAFCLYLAQVRLQGQGGCSCLSVR